MHIAVGAVAAQHLQQSKGKYLRGRSSCCPYWVGILQEGCLCRFMHKQLLRQLRNCSYVATAGTSLVAVQGGTHPFFMDCCIHDQLPLGAAVLQQSRECTGQAGLRVFCCPSS